MMERVNYEFKKDSLGRKYALKVDIKSGKKQRIKYKIAQRRAANLKASRKKSGVVDKIKTTESGATYTDYKRVLPVIEKELTERRKKEGLKPLSKSVMRGRVKQIAIEHRTGIATRMRFAWVYRVVLERYVDDNGDIKADCDTSIFRARGLKRNGDHFTRMSSICQSTYDKIMALDLCSVDGGACVVLYDKFSKDVIKQFELGKGCGFSFDFENYTHNDPKNEYTEGDYDWI